VKKLVRLTSRSWHRAALTGLHQPMGTTCFVKSSHGESMRKSRAVMDRSTDAEKLDELIVRALNKIRKPSTAEEITELLNLELGPRDQFFDAKEVETWLRSARSRAVPLYWLATRPRR
jgi:hypothetical protein